MSGLESAKWKDEEDVVISVDARRESIAWQLQYMGGIKNSKDVKIDGILLISKTIVN
jgi:hypothetical protein